MSERIVCPECRGDGTWTDRDDGWVQVRKCGPCKGEGTIPDRRATTANDRIVARVKAWAERTTENNTDPMQVVLNIIREEQEAERGNDS